MTKILQTLFFFLLVTQICFAQWYQQKCDTTALLESVHFIDEFTGWSVGHECCAAEASILYTTDGGTVWHSRISGITNWLFDVYFTDADTGWVVGSDGMILRTTDGGANWDSQPSGVSSSLFDVQFVNSDIGWIAGGDCFVWGFVLHTTNSGTSWTIQLIDTTLLMCQITGVHFTDMNTGWVTVGNGKILHTTDSGTTWVEQLNSPSILGLHDIYFADSFNGWVVGDNGTILHTTDSGTTWFSQTSGTINRLNSIYFTDADRGWAVGDHILQTSDGGTTWLNQLSGAWWLSDVHFNDANTGWTVGHIGIILHTTNGGVTFVEEAKINDVPTEFLLSQNYPNPFNPSTKIKYSIPQTSEVQIKVFDVLGNEIEILVKEEKPAGTYEVTWYAVNLPSGVYLYQLKAGSYIETKKMLLLK